MLALKSYEQNEGFSVMTADEMYFVNGGSCSTGEAVAIMAAGGVIGGVAFGIAGGVVAGPVGAVKGAVEGACLGVGAGAAAVTALNTCK